MGLLPDSFLFGYSWHQFTLANQGYVKRTDRNWEEAWKRTRLVAWTLECIATGFAGGEAPSLHAYLPLPSDPEAKPLTEEQLRWEHERFLRELENFE